MEKLFRTRLKVLPFIVRLILKNISDKQFYLLSFFYLHYKGKGKIYFPRIENPTTFNEKTIFMKLYYRQTPIDYFADKYKVREYVAQKIGEKFLVPLIKVYNNANEIDFEYLPKQFVLKVNHGSGWNIVVLDKEGIHEESIRHQLNHRLHINYYSFGREWQYKNIKPVILCEKLLVNKDGSPITDFKVFCFNGSAKYIQIDLDRFTNHRRQFYDRGWNLQPFTTLFPRENKPVAKPEHLTEILELAEKLAEGFMFVRVDFYYDGSNIHFGELTLHHGGGCEPFIPSEYDLALGKIMKLKK